MVNCWLDVFSILNLLPRSVTTDNLDKEGLKFQVEEHAVARILEVLELQGDHCYC